MLSSGQSCGAHLRSAVMILTRMLLIPYPRMSAMILGFLIPEPSLYGKLPLCRIGWYGKVCSGDGVMVDLVVILKQEQHAPSGAYI